MSLSGKLQDTKFVLSFFKIDKRNNPVTEINFKLKKYSAVNNIPQAMHGSQCKAARDVTSTVVF